MKPTFSLQWKPIKHQWKTIVALFKNPLYCLTKQGINNNSINFNYIYIETNLEALP